MTQVSADGVTGQYRLAGDAPTRDLFNRRTLDRDAAHLVPQPASRGRVRVDVAAQNREWDQTFVAWVPVTTDQSIQGQSIAAIAEHRGLDAIDALFDVLIESFGEASLVLFVMDEQDVRYERMVNVYEGSDPLATGRLRHTGHDVAGRVRAISRAAWSYAGRAGMEAELTDASLPLLRHSSGKRRVKAGCRAEHPPRHSEHTGLYIDALDELNPNATPIDCTHRLIASSAMNACTTSQLRLTEFGCEPRVPRHTVLTQFVGKR
jgi:hypothetical protein